MLRSRSVLFAVVLVVAGVGFVGCPWLGPVASFTAYPRSGMAPLDVKFTDTSFSLGPRIMDRSWNFGDGFSSAERNPVHTYENTGTFTVALTVTTDWGTSTVVRKSLIKVSAAEGEGEGEGEGQTEFTSAAANQSYRWDDTDTAVGEGEGEDNTARQVVEPDVIRRDGNLLYVLNQYRGLLVVDLEASNIVAQVPTYGYPRDLYTSGDRAYVLVSYANNYAVDGNTISYSIASRIYVVDISDPAGAHILSSFDLNGDFVDSRMVGDVLYAVCSEFEWSYVYGVAVDTAEVTKNQTSSSWVTSINVADPGNIRKVDEVSFDGMGNIIQATNSAIFVAAPDNNWYDGATTITYVDIADPAGDIAVRGSVAVPGQVADKYKMDVYNGVLRVVSGGWDTASWIRRVYIDTVDLSDPDNLGILGEMQLDNAVGETLYATRFDGPRGYIVTYLTKDPLFILDFSDPAKPVVAGKLVVPGWSTYIEPQGNRLIALGVDDTAGQRVSVSMYDVTDPANPSMVGARVTFGDSWSWSSAYGDVKAFTVLDDVLIVPFSGWTSDFGGYERLQFVSYSTNGLAARGYVDVDGQVMRSFKHDNLFYGVTTEQLATIDASDLDNPTVTDKLTLAEYVADYLELPATDAYAELNAEIVTKYDAGKMEVKTLGPGGAVLGAADVEIGSFTKAFASGSSVILVGATSSGYYTNNWDWVYEGYYTVAIVDCSTPETPTANVFKVNVQPYYQYYYCYLDYAYSDSVSSDVRPGSWWYYSSWQPQQTVFLLGDSLALLCTGETYDSVLGDEAPSYGLAMVDISTPSVKTVGLGYPGIVSLDAVGSKLYLGTQENLDEAGTPRAMCSFYVREIDPAGPSSGLAANVPGSFVQYDAAADVLTLRDQQWKHDSSIQSSLKTVSWDGGDTASLLDAVDLPDGVSTVLGRGPRVYLDAYTYSYNDGYYDANYALYAVLVGAAGNLSLSEKIDVTDAWGWLLDADATTAYVAIGNAIARYDFSSGGMLRDLTQTMGYPASVRFGDASAHVMLGYSGVANIPR